MSKNKPAGKWYFGGIASAMAASCTHPLDLVKVHLQTQKSKELNMVGVAVKVVREDGVLALYNGISASILRQLTYSMTRFGIFETYKANKGVSNLPFHESAAVSMTAGFIGGIVGNPADMINVRMQNDIKLPRDQRRNYKNALEGILRVLRTEGPLVLFSGVSMTATRASLMTFGQLAFYDKFKQLFLSTDFFQDNIATHFSASVCATLVQCFRDLALVGPSAFFKGLVPAFIRLGPHTILTFVFLEQLKEHFGQRKD